MTYNTPKVSVLMAVHNGQEFIYKSIKSILNQNYKNFEIIIINDHSTDDTKKIIEKINLKKIKIINLKKNVGPYKALDIGMQKISGKYISILDSDDIIHPNKFRTQVKILENDQKVGLVATWYKIIDKNSKIIKIFKINSNKNFFNFAFPCQNLICNSSVMFRRDILKKIKFYNKSFFYSNDYHFYLKIFINYEIRIIKNFYTYYRSHLNQRTHDKKLKSIIYKENLMNLDWAKRNNLINNSNIFLYYKNYLKNYFKLIFNY
jgi:glycosyltransferase involved in cell wall biosynthesis